jgi:hypothetical protein
MVQADRSHRVPFLNIRIDGKRSLQCHGIICLYVYSITCLLLHDTISV